MQGHFNCAQQFMMPLFGASIKEINLAKLDAAIYLFQPMRFLILFFTGFMVLFQLYVPSTSSITVVTELLPTWFWVVVNVFILIQIPLAMLLERVPWMAYLGLPLFPLFMITWFPVTFLALFTRHNRVWQHTVHTRAIRLDELRSR